MGKTRDNAAYILKRMEVPTLARAYVLGCGAKRVTVLSQQARAFNLIWALFAKGHLKEGDLVGIAGGGIGGLTTAAAALIKGCRVILVESRQVLMHVQRLNTTRLLHPNIYDWPHPGAEVESTNFPCMNWTADRAGEVVATLDDEWAQLVEEHKPAIQPSTRIRALKSKGPEGKLVMEGESWESDPCDVVVVAVGFGIEPGVSGVSLKSYWENDNLAQSVRGTQVVKRVLISGLGDGACIDVLRLKYANFDHRRFAAAVTRNAELERHKTKLIKIDLQLHKVPPDDQATYLATEYGNLSFSARLAHQLGDIRTDTHVVLNGTEGAPLSVRACILHRVAIWGLMNAGLLEYRIGRLDQSAIEIEGAPSGIQYKVSIPGLPGRHTFDEVVLRHGPRACLGELEGGVSAYQAIPEDPAKDHTRSKRYPDDFYPPRSAGRPVVSGDRNPLRTSSPAAGSIMEEPGTPTVAEAVASPLDVYGSVQAALPQAGSTLLIDVEILTRILATETRSQNFIEAKDAADRLEAIVSRPEINLPNEAWQAANKALWNFELFRSGRLGGTSETHDLARLRELIERMDRARE